LEAAFGEQTVGRTPSV